MSGNDDNDDYKEPIFPIAKEDIPVLVGAGLMFVLTVLVVYFIFIRPSPFDAWFAMLHSKDAAQTQVHKPANAMMPAEAVPAAKGAAAPAAAPASAAPEEPEAPAGSEAPEKPESPAAK